MKTTKANPSREPTHLDSDTWYYEYRGRLELVVWTGETTNKKVSHIKIPWRKLMASAKRCRPEEFGKATR